MKDENDTLKTEINEYKDALTKEKAKSEELNIQVNYLQNIYMQTAARMPSPKTPSDLNVSVL